MQIVELDLDLVREQRRLFKNILKIVNETEIIRQRNKKIKRLKIKIPINRTLRRDAKYKCLNCNWGFFQNPIYFRNLYFGDAGIELCFCSKKCKKEYIEANNRL